METEMTPRQQSLMRTEQGRTVAVSRLARGVLPPGVPELVLDVSCEPYDSTAVWVPLTAAEARRLAELLLEQAAAADPSAADPHRTGRAS